MNGVTIPAMKVENAPSPQIKVDPACGHTDEEDVYEDEGDLDFTMSERPQWLSRVPKSLWEVLASMPEDGEIEIGTVRVEGDMTNPTRVSKAILNSCSCFLRGFSGQSQARNVASLSRTSKRVQYASVQARGTPNQAISKRIRLLRKGYAWYKKKGY